MKSVLWILLALGSGGMVGWGILPDGSVESLDLLIQILLCVLVFSAGIDVGVNWPVMQELLRKGHQIIWVPVVITLGTLAGGVIAAYLVGLRVWDTLAIVSAMGWYTLAGPMVTEAAGTSLGTIAFLSNLMREIIAFISIPFVARYFGMLYAVAPSGATAMDSTLPLISRFTNPQVSMIAFFSGFVLSTIPPFLISFFLKMGGW